MEQESSWFQNIAAMVGAGLAAASGATFIKVAQHGPQLKVAEKRLDAHAKDIGDLKVDMAGRKADLQHIIEQLDEIKRAVIAIKEKEM